jgi:hypothetical protein
MKAYLMGKRIAAQETMDMVAMALLDKCGWHTLTEGEDDRQSIEMLYHALEDIADSINRGYVKRRDIKTMLREESGLQFSD